MYKIICIDASLEALDEKFMRSCAREAFESEQGSDISAIVFLKDAVIPENHTLPLRLLVVANENAKRDIKGITWFKNLMIGKENDNLFRSSLFLISTKNTKNQLKIGFEKDFGLVIDDIYEYGTIVMNCGIPPEAEISGLAIKGFIK